MVKPDDSSYRTDYMPTLFAVFYIRYICSYNLFCFHEIIFQTTQIIKMQIQLAAV